MTIVFAVGGNPAPLPLAPTLLDPANGSYDDLSGTPTFEWQYNAGDPSSGTTQTHYAFVRITNGGTTLWWNAGTSSWQSTEVWNTGTTTAGNSVFSLTFPSGSWPDGNTYQWAVATEDANGKGPLAGYFTVIAQALPSVTVNAPAGTITSSDPVVTWTPAFPSGAAQTAYRMAVYDAATYGKSGFTPGGTSDPDPNAVYDTGTVGSSSVSSVDLSAVPLYLDNGTQFRAYVQLTETGGEQSDWGYSSFTVNYTPSKTPTVTLSQTTDSSTGYPVLEMVVQGHDNLLSAADAVPPTGTGKGTWAAGANTALGTGTAPDGSFALSLTASAAGAISAETAKGTSGYAVQAATEYTVLASLLAGSTGRTCTVAVEWFDASGTSLGTDTGSAFSDATAAMTLGSVTATSPAQAAFAAVLPTVESAAAGEEHWLRGAAILLGSDTTWGPGGLVGLQDAILLRSDGLYARGASISNPATLDATTQQLKASTWGPAGALYDYEAIQHAAVTYSCQLLVTYGANQSVLSPAGVSGSVTFELSGVETWWSIDPTAPSTACNAQMTHWQPASVRQATAHPVTGLTTMNIVSDTQLKQDFEGVAEVFDDATYTALDKLLTSGATIFVSSNWGANDSGYFYVGPEPGGISMGAGVKSKHTTLHASTYGAGHREVRVIAVARPRPAV